MAGNVAVRQEYWVSFTTLVILHFRMFYESVRASNGVTPCFPNRMCQKHNLRNFQCLSQIRKEKHTESRDSITVPPPLSCVIQTHAVLRCAKPPLVIENVLLLYKKVGTTLIIGFPF